MQAKAPEYGCRFQSFSLDGQDRDGGADYVLTDADRFAIVEFKYSDRDLVSEKFKTRRLTLCRKLELREDMRALHDLCHFISWSEGTDQRVLTNIYRHEICTQRVFGSSCGLRSQLPFAVARTPAGEFAQDFFAADGRRSLSLDEFERYLAWVLTETSASTNSTVELVTHNPHSHDLALVRLNSIADAQTWVRTHVTPPPPRSRPRPGGGI
jgi:hypothetical protein